MRNRRKARQKYSNRDMGKLLKGYCLTTAEVLYRIPDYPNLLQSFIWQTLDLPPDEVTLGRVMAVIDGRESEPTSNVTTQTPTVRALHDTWREVAAVQHDMLHATTFAELVEKAKGESEPMYYI